MIKILIAEDSGVIRRLLTQIVEKEKNMEIIGYAVDGEEACQQTVKLSPDIIVMDMRMPKLSGLDAIKKIMAEKPTPIIMFSSAEPSVNVRADALKSGAVSFIAKPSSMDYTSITNKLITEIRSFSQLKLNKRPYDINVK